MKLFSFVCDAQMRKHIMNQSSFVGKNRHQVKKKSPLLKTEPRASWGHFSLGKSQIFIVPQAVMKSNFIAFTLCILSKY